MTSGAEKIPGTGRSLVSLEAVEEAAAALEGKVIRTPLLPHPILSRETESELRLKCESLQHTGSFKARGALNFLRSLSREALEAGVITYSSGNHGQAVAYAAGIQGVRSVVIMPVTAPTIKRDGARSLGADVVFEGTTSRERQERAEEIQAREGLTMVPPFDDPRIIAGQGTSALEAVRDWPEADTFVVPVGGGGLASGWGVVVRALRPEARLVGVEAEGAASMSASLEAGRPVVLDRIDTIADGLAPVRPGDLTYHHLQALFDEVVTVPDPAIREAARELLRRRKLVVEFSGAASVAAVMTGAVEVEGRKVVVVLSGGNLDPTLLTELVA